MEEIKLTEKELQNIINNNRMIGSGAYGALIEYGDQLLKIDIGLYRDIKDKNITNLNFVINEYYKCYKNVHDINQLDALFNKQKYITLTQLPRGIVTLKSDDKEIDGKISGLIIHYHKNHDKLENLNPQDYKRVLIIMKKLLLAVRELEDNRISQTDIIHYPDYDIENRVSNVIYKDDDPQIVDMDGFFVIVGERYTNANGMYRDLGNLVFDYFCLNNMKHSFVRDKLTSYDEVRHLIRDFEKGIKRRW